MLYLLMSEYVCATGGSKASSILSSRLSETGLGFSLAALQTYSPFLIPFEASNPKSVQIMEEAGYGVYVLG